MEYIKSMSLSDWGSWFSIIGFALTLATFVLVAKIKKGVGMRHQRSSSIQSLKEYSEDLTTLVGSYSIKRHEIQELLLKLKYKLSHLEKDSPALRKSVFSDAINEIKSYGINGASLEASEGMVRRIITLTNILIDDLDTEQKAEYLKG